MECHGCVPLKKRKGKQYNLSLITMAVGMNIKWETGEVNWNFGEENQDIKNRDGEEYQVDLEKRRKLD